MKMKKLTIILAIVGLCLAIGSRARAAVQATFDFDDSWSADYTPGWENLSYRHGLPPVGKMMEYTAGGRNGTGGMKLIADSTPESWMWWAGVGVMNVNPAAMQKEHAPWISVWLYDEGFDTTANALQKAGQMLCVPSWVNPYISGSEDWTDVQFGAVEYKDPPSDNYYYVAVGEGHPGWQDTTVGRVEDGWVQLKMQLSSTAGEGITFSLRTNENHLFQVVGTSYRTDYVDLGTEIGLYTRFTTPLDDWGTDKPAILWDDYSFGSNFDGPAFVPEPASIIIWGLLGAGCAGGAMARRRRRRARWSDDTRQNIHQIIDRGRTNA
jgi:hypothetical protein